jgi:hypothetical protein
MARASPGSGSHPGNLLAAFFGERACGEPSFREGPALPVAFPPRPGPRLLGGLLIAAMLHGVGVRAVPASHPVASKPRQTAVSSKAVLLPAYDASIVVSTCLIASGRQPLDKRRIDARPPGIRREKAGKANAHSS